MDMVGLANLLRPPEEEKALVPAVTPATLGQHLPATADDDDGEYSHVILSRMPMHLLCYWSLFECLYLSLTARC